MNAPAAPIPHRTDTGWTVPGIANLHSHAFQRAMAGLAERRSTAGTAPADSFWTWRETMYHFAARMDPDSLHAVAYQLYVEMLEAGYTTVCEFHYLHQQPGGVPYADPAAMSLALVAAAQEAGIRLTLLPVLYMEGGFDGRALSERQRRFGLGVEAYLHLLEGLHARQGRGLRVGCALHSLRAVPAAAMAQVLGALPAQLPVHIHIAEQQAEVDDCLAARGARPVRWLLDHAPVDARWTLVHATHLDAGEVQGIARSGATVALCPTTEANLGDGLFPLVDYQAAGGAWGIGSDSHIMVSPVEELRWLEYGQRLASHRRNVVADPANVSTGEALLRGVQRSAARASGWSAAELALDHIVVDARAARMAGAHAGDVADRWIFGGRGDLVQEVWVDDRRWVEGGRHRHHDAAAARYRDAMARLLKD